MLLQHIKNEEMLSYALHRVSIYLNRHQINQNFDRQDDSDYITIPFISSSNETIATGCKEITISF